MSTKSNVGCVSGPAVRATAANSNVAANLLVKVSGVDGPLTAVSLPGALTDNVEGVCDDVLSTTRCSVIPMNPDREVRVTMYGTGSAGDELVLTASAYGRLASRATANATYHVKAVALENFVSGQVARVRPCQFTRIVA
jgi:hypothetical protein